MKHLVVVLVVLIGAAAGAYAQDTIKQEEPGLNDVVQVGVLYTGSICGGDDVAPAYTEFYFRVIRELKDGWVEADYNRYLSQAYGRRAFQPWPKPVRLNIRQMCSIRVTDLNP